MIASDGTEGYSASVGLLHPLDASWTEYDLTGLTGITFEFRNSAKITDYLAVSFGSATYTDDVAKAGTVYEVGIKGAANLAASTKFKEASVDILDFALPTWWTAPEGFPTIEDVLKRVKNLQFTPKTAYTANGTQNGVACTKCVEPSMPSQTLEIRNIALVGADRPLIEPPLQGFTCYGYPRVESLVLDSLFDNTTNEAGGSWSVMSDYDSTRASSDDTQGSSNVSFTVTPGNLDITMSAALDKTIGGNWHARAGWASLSTGFPRGSRLNAQGLKGISFHIKATKLDRVIKYIAFKVGIQGVSDTATHQVRLPAVAISGEVGYSFCILPQDLLQESFVKEKVDPDVTRITRLSWEAKITDNTSPTISSADAQIILSDVRFHGLTAPDGWSTKGLLVAPEDEVHVGARVARSAFTASYANGFLNLDGVQGIKTMDVLSLDGRKVASFAPASRVRLDLPRGTWLLSCRRDGAPLIRSFAVVGR